MNLRKAVKEKRVKSVYAYWYMEYKFNQNKKRAS